MKMIELKNWLNRNKIFFEIFSSICLSIMAIIVAVISNKIAVRQNELTDLSLQPSFSLSHYVSNYDSVKNKYLQLNLDLINSSGHFYNLETKIISYFQVDYYKNGIHGQFSVPIIGVYSNEISTSEIIGTVVKFS